VNGYSKAQPAHTSQLDHTSFLEFEEKALPLGLRDVKLTGGEPLLCEDIGEIIGGLNPCECCRQKVAMFRLA
jgi:molybdenum cofactor biosynthesis enzyme MoaA